MVEMVHDGGLGRARGRVRGTVRPVSETPS